MLKTLVEEPIPSLASSKSEFNYETELESKKDIVRNAINYLMKNKEALDENTVSEINSFTA